jgi:hypothetical protein
LAIRAYDKAVQFISWIGQFGHVSLLGDPTTRLQPILANFPDYILHLPRKHGLDNETFAIIAVLNILNCIKAIVS